MEVTVHLGAHRTASTSMQVYLRQNQALLRAQGLGFWGPHRMRNGVLRGVITPRGEVHCPRSAARAQGRIALRLAHSQQGLGLDHLLVTDENFLGTMRRNFAARRLYPNAGERLMQLNHGFGGRIKQVLLSIRSLDQYWVSALRYCIPRGQQVPDAARLAQLVHQPRNWRDVITDLSLAAPQARIFVAPFERFAARPDLSLSAAIEHDLPPAHGIWVNKSPSLPELLRLPLDSQERARLNEGQTGDHWTPLTPEQRAELQERYADDMHWLQAGAEGKAQLVAPSKPENKTGSPLHIDPLTRGHEDDQYQRLARPG